MKIDPSTEQTDYGAIEAASPDSGSKTPTKRPTKTVYPDVRLRGDAADQIIADHAAGETFEADVTFKVTAIHPRKGGTAGYGDDNESSVELEIISIDKEDGPPDSADEEDAESAVDSYRASKAAPPEEED